MAADSCNVAPPRGSLVSAKPRAKSSAVHQPYDQKISNRSGDRLDVVRLLQPGALLPGNRPEKASKFPRIARFEERYHSPGEALGSTDLKKGEYE